MRRGKKRNEADTVRKKKARREKNEKKSEKEFFFYSNKRRFSSSIMTTAPPLPSPPLLPLHRGRDRQRRGRGDAPCADADAGPAQERVPPSQPRPRRQHDGLGPAVPVRVEAVGDGHAHDGSRREGGRDETFGGVGGGCGGCIALSLDDDDDDAGGLPERGQGCRPHPHLQRRSVGEAPVERESAPAARVRVALERRRREHGAGEAPAEVGGRAERRGVERERERD